MKRIQIQNTTYVTADFEPKIMICMYIFYDGFKNSLNPFQVYQAVIANFDLGTLKGQ